MEQLKRNWHLSIASLTLVIYLGVSRYVPLPDFLMGFCLGLVLVLYPYGLYKASKFSKKRIQ